MILFGKPKLQFQRSNRKTQGSNHKIQCSNHKIHGDSVNWLDFTPVEKLLIMGINGNYTISYHDNIPTTIGTCKILRMIVLRSCKDFGKISLKVQPEDSRNINLEKFSKKFVQTIAPKCSFDIPKYR